MSVRELPAVERAHDLLPARRPQLEAMFAPRAVAVIGASERAGSVGRTIFENLLAHEFGGAVFPVNPHREHVLGRPAFARIGEVPVRVDLAVVVTPAATVPGIIAECGDAGVTGAVVVSAGFRETGAAGRALEEQALAAARRGKLRMIGPNCLGVMFPHAGLNATFAAGMARPGSVGFISQSGALCTAVLDWSFRENVGFSAFLSVGAMADVGWGDLIYWLGDDPHTRSIVLYMESIGDARTFLSAAREVALTKPIIVIKVGRTAQAARAAASHTGALTGSDAVLDAAFRRVGVLRVDSIGELFDMAEILAKQPRALGPRLAIVTNAGGPAALATDRLVQDGAEIAALSTESMEAFDRLLPAHWSHGNPVDILGDAGAQRYLDAVEIVARDPQNDGVLTILTPQAMTDCTGTAQRLGAFARTAEKPILASWMGGQEVAAGVAALNDAGVPTFQFADRAARAFATMWRYSRGIDALYETPALSAHPEASGPACHRAGRIIAEAREAGRTLLTEFESKRLLGAWGIPVLESHVATSEVDAVERAESLGGPVAIKLHSRTITHKARAGGVKLNVHGVRAVRHAWREIRAAVPAADFDGVTVQPMLERRGYELILGSSLDPQFGPVLLFGTGGSLVEVLEDRALGFPPLNATLARRLVERTRIFRALSGERGVDLAALDELLVRFSQLVAAERWIREIDINPLHASGADFVALDARIVLHGAEVPEADLPRLAIRPYPAQYVTPWTLRDGTAVSIRPLRPEDEPMMIQFHRTLSEESVHFRYFAAMNLAQRVAHERLRRICFLDYDREIALVAERRHGGSREILGVGRLSRLHGEEGAEFAIVVADAWQRRGLGTRLLELLVHIAREENLPRLVAHILPGNSAMQRITRQCGFTLRHDPAAHEWAAEMKL